MRKYELRNVKLIIIIAIFVGSLAIFCNKVLWFWFVNPELTQMQVLVEKWPWMLFLIGVSIFTMLNLDKANRKRN